MFKRSVLIALILGCLIAPSTTSAIVFERPLSLGSTGPDVSALQTILKEKGFYLFPAITGYFGPITSQAVAAFQRSAGLESVGFVGPQTRALLNGGSVSSPSVTLASIITTLQRLLQEHGYYEGDITGTLNEATLRAVQSVDTETSTSPRRSSGGGGGNDDDEEEEEVADTSGPTLSSIASSPSDTSATITWTTNEPANSRVDYGTTTSYGTASTSAALSTSHSITLTGLTASTTYHFRIQSADALSNTSTTSDQTFTTTAEPDTTAPTISSISSGTPGETTATISWTTNEAADSQIAYGTTASYGATTTLDATLVTSHSVELTGLSASTTYHYRIRTADSSGNARFSSDQTFTTASSADVTAPSVSITAPANGATISGNSVSVTATASDNVSVAGVTFYADGVRQGSEDTDGTYGIVLDSTSLTNASHALVAVARDTSNNYATSTTVTVTVDNTVPDTTPPVISSISSGTPGQTSATITWTTDEAANSRVDYGTTASYGTASTSASLVTSHSVTLTGLTAATTYHFRIQSADASSNTATSSDQTFTTSAAPDTTAPVISSIASSTTETTATISWTTDEAATSVVNYGATASYGSASSSAALVTSHSVELTGLTADTTYHFQIQSLDSAGNTATSSDGTFTTDSGAVVLEVDRPAVALDEAWNLWGDSTTFGVGAPTGEDYPQKLRDIVASGVSSISCSSGTSGNMGTKNYVCNNGIAGENTGTISGRVSTLAAGANAAEMARPQIFSGGLNNFNTAVTGWSRDWPAQVKADFATEISKISGGRDYAYILAPATDDGMDGMQQGASHVFNRRDMIATYGRHVLDMQRYLRDYPQPGTGTDYFSTYTDGALPTSLRGSGGVAVTYSDAQPLTGAGTPSDLAAADMQPYWDTTNRRLYRKVGASGTGSWDLVDRKHFSAAGNELIARMVADFMMASQGDGPPFVTPQEYLITSDIAEGATVGQLVYTGTSTDFYLTNTDGSEQSLYTISNTGLIERSGTGTLDVGVETYTVWAANEHGMLSSALDIYVDKPAAAAPQKFDITGSGAALYGRESHAFPSGTKISGAFLVKVSSFSDSSYLMNFSKGIGDSTFLAQINTSGRIRFVGNNASSTLAINATTAAGVTVPLNTWTWVLFSIDLATPSAQVYINDTAATLSTSTFTSSLNFADMTPRFLSVREPQLYDDGLSVVKGGVGPVIVFPDYVDWSNATNRRALFDASGNPATRTPFSDVGGKSPYFDTSSGLGGFLWGTSDPDNAQSLLVPSFRARNLFTPAS